MSTPKTSRQRAYQVRQVAAGLCRLCANPHEPGGPHCTRHREAATRRVRKKNGNKPWRPGGPGRPPKRISG